MSWVIQPNAVPQRRDTPHPTIPITTVPVWVAKSICECLDGGRQSCISWNGTIPEDRLLCAARVAMRDYPGEVRKVISQTIQAGELIQRILYRLDSKYSISFPQKKQERLLALKTTGLESVVNTLSRALQSLEAWTIREKLLSTQFMEWDTIVMNALADNYYTYTGTGSRGIIISPVIDEEVGVRFTHLSFGHPDEKVFRVSINAMDLVERNADDIGSDSMKLSRREKEILRDIIREYVSSELDTFVTRSELARLLQESRMIVPHGTRPEAFALNRNALLSVIEPSVQAAYENRELYSPSGSEVPPAERKPGTIAFELSEGCKHGQCTFCDLYGGTSFRAKTKEGFRNHVDAVLEAIGPDSVRRIRRVFLGGANALSADLDDLIDWISYTRDRLNNPQRVALYGRTADILQKKERGLRILKETGLDLIYLWIESGSNTVLEKVQKGNTAEATVRAAKLAESAEIELSVMIMLWLWGHSFSQEHALETAKLLNTIETRYITFLTVTAEENTPYAKSMRQEMDAGTNRPLTNLEIVQQLRLLIQNLEPNGQKIGMFWEETHSAGSNPITFRQVFDNSGKQEILELCDVYIRAARRMLNEWDWSRGSAEKDYKQGLRDLFARFF